MHSVWHPILVLFQILAPILGGGFNSGGGGGTATYTFVQACSASTTSVTCNTTTGHLAVVVSTAFGTGTGPTFTSSDGSSSLTNTTGTPAHDATTTYDVATAYIFNTLSTGSKTYSCTWGSLGGSSGTVDCAVLEFSYTGTPAFDKDGSVEGSGTTINLPSISPLATGSLMIQHAGSSNTQTACNSPWTTSGTTAAGDLYCYLTNSSTPPITANTSQPGGGNWFSQIAVFH